jgi:hypothetical protein
VNFTHPDWRGDSLGYWPSYAALSPAGRAAYLAWLGSSRAAPQTPIGYVFLYFYGLERRVLTDLADPSDSLDYPAELLQLAAEVKRLQVVYGSDYVFARYAAGLQSVIQYMLEPTSSPTGPPPAVTANTWEFPLDISLGLARFAKAGQPIPPDWALAWVRANPDLYLRTPARRCPQLFAELFTIRYQRQYGAGLILDPARKLLNVPYRPASAGFRGVSVNPFGSLPDVRTQAAPNKALRDLTEQCTQALDPLSRYLGRHPGQVGSLPSIALLPAELILSRTADPALTLLNSWLETKLADRSEVLIAGTDLVGHWTPKIPGMLNKDEAQSQALLLTSLGFGIEPDIRYTGINPGSGPAVLFRQASLPPPPLPSKIAGAVLQLATVVSAPRALTAATLDEATNQIQRLLDLPADTRPRTHAKLRQTVASPPKLASAKRALAATDQNAREWIAALLIDLASAAGPPLPAQISALTKAYQALGLDPDAVYGHVHAHRPRPAASPVEIRPAGPSASGGAIPPPVFSQGNVILDPSVIAHTLAQSTQSAALLNRIFADDNAPTTQAPPPGPPCLDSAHTALLHALTARTLWSKAEVAELAVRHGLPVAGAIETLNEAAFEVCGDPVLEGDDQVEVNPAVLKELL